MGSNLRSLSGDFWPGTGINFDSFNGAPDVPSPLSNHGDPSRAREDGRARASRASDMSGQARQPVSVVDLLAERSEAQLGASATPVLLAISALGLCPRCLAATESFLLKIPRDKLAGSVPAIPDVSLTYCDGCGHQWPTAQLHQYGEAGAFCKDCFSSLSDE